MRSRRRPARLRRPGNPRPGRPGLRRPPRREKRRKATGGGAGGGGRELQVPGRKFHEGGGMPSLQFPPLLEIIGKLLPTSSGTSDTFLHFPADKALLKGARGCPPGKRKRVPSSPSPRPRARPAPNHRTDWCHCRPTSRLGLQGARPGRHQHF